MVIGSRNSLQRERERSTCSHGNGEKRESASPRENKVGKLCFPPLYYLGGPGKGTRATLKAFPLFSLRCLGLEGVGSVTRDPNNCDHFSTSSQYRDINPVPWIVRGFGPSSAFTNYAATADPHCACSRQHHHVTRHMLIRGRQTSWQDARQSASKKKNPIIRKVSKYD